jgi:hypothetical protein
MPNHTNHLPFFDAHRLPAGVNAYVAWVDVMGIQGIMSRSLPISANFVFKLHIVALEAPRNNVELYPVMDGIDAVSSDQAAIVAFLDYLFVHLADLFVSTPDTRHRFLVKGALAFGPIIHGSWLPAPASTMLDENAPSRCAILLGIPMIQLDERNAPPFGLFVDESARAFAPANQLPLKVAWWTWFRLNQWQALAQELRQELENYFTWCLGRAQAIGYEAERIEAHRKLARQYLVDLP